MNISRSRMRRTVASALSLTLGVTVVGALPSGAAIADGTSTVAGIPGVCEGAAVPQIAVDTEGNQAAAWYCPRRQGEDFAFVQASMSANGAAWTPAQEVLAESNGGLALALYDGRALVTGGTQVPGTAVAVFVDADGVRPLIVADSAVAPVVATNGSGDVLVAWQGNAEGQGEAMRVATGTFDAGLTNTAMLTTPTYRRESEYYRASIDDAGNAAVVWGYDRPRLATATLDQDSESQWQIQELPGYSPNVMVGGGQVTATWAVFHDELHYECFAAQQPIGGSPGTPIDLGMCPAEPHVVLAQNDGGLGLMVVNRGEIHSNSVSAYVIPPGGAPTGETDLSGGSTFYLNLLADATVDETGIATMAWVQIGDWGDGSTWVQTTASMDISPWEPEQAIDGQFTGMVDRHSVRTVRHSGVAQSVPSVMNVAHGTLDGHGTAISLASKRPGLLAAIWARGTSFGRGNLAPSVTGLSAHAAPVGGGSTIAIRGAKLLKDSVVYFGDVRATSVTYVSPTQLKVTVPPHPRGEVSVRVIAQGGSTVSAKSMFVYGPAPSIDGLSPRMGGIAGGTEVTITGSNFVPNTTVKFAATAATNVQYVSPNEIVVTAPKHSAGTVAVKATTLAGSSGTTDADLFAYGPSKVARFSPASAVTGGTVTISGASFLPGSIVTVGGLESPSVIYKSGTQLRTVVPNGASTGVITVIGPSGATTSAKALKVTFSITAFSPSGGPPGTVIDVSGVGFTTKSIVSIKGVAASTTYLSPTHLQAVVPDGAVSGPVTVRKGAGAAGTVSSADAFTVG